MIKKVTALLILAGVIFTNIAFAAEITDIENTVYEKPAKLLMALGIMEEIGSGEFGTENSISRGSFAGMIIKTFGYSKDALASGEKIYKDVDETTDEGKCIDVLYKKGYISPAENFFPNEEITFNEAVKIIASAMGGKDIAEKNGGYPNGYLKYADDIGILKNVRESGTLTKANAAMLLYNTLKTEVFDNVSFVLSENAGTGKPLMEKVFGIKEDKGIVTGTDKTKLYSKNGAGKGNVEIDNEIYFADNFEIYDYLGYEVDFYYSDEDGDKSLVLFIPSSKNEITLINSENIVNAENSRIIYLNHYGRETAKKFDINADYILNGMCSALSDKSELLIDNGTLKLIDNNGDGTAEVIVADSYINYIVSAYMNGIIYSKNGMNNINIEELAERDIVFENEAEFSNIREWTVLSVYSDVFAQINGRKMCDFENSEIVKIEISNSKVSGMVNGKDEENIIIDEVEYQYSHGIYEEIKNEKFSSSEYTFYLDIMNKVAAYDKSALESIQSGILGRVYFDEAEDNKTQIKIYNENGQWTRYNTAEKITIDGNKGKRAQIVSGWLEENGGKIESQFILFRLNAAGEINYIDTSYKSEAEEKKYTLCAGAVLSGQKYRTGSATFEGLGGVGANTKLFIAAGDRTAFTINPDDEEKFKFYSSAKSYLKDNSTYYAKLYNVDEAYVAEYVVIYVQSNAQSVVEASAGICVFDSITAGLNEDDERIYNLKFYDRTGKLNTAAASRDVVFYKKENGENITISAESLKKGDIIRIDSTGGSIGAVQLAAAINSEPVYGTVIAEGAQAGYIQQTRVVCGRVYAKNDLMYSMYYGNDLSSLKNNEDIHKELEAQNLEGVSVLIVDREKKTVEKGTSADVSDYLSTGDEGSYVFLYQSYGTPNTIVVVR